MDTTVLSIQREAACDLCGERDFELLADRARCGAALQTVICRHCGLVAHGSVPSEEALAQYYRRQYRFDYHGEFTPSPHRVVREWNRGAELLRLLGPYLDYSDRIVEIGSGIGCTIGNFRCAGYAASGVEPGEGFRRFATERLGVPVRGGVLADLARQPMAEVILLVHVLEHLRSPRESLRHIRTLLSAGGRCYIEVPNAGAPHAAPGKMFHFAHIYNFTRDTLAMLAGQAGFRVHRWLSGPQDKNLCLLLECSEQAAWSVIPGSYQRARASMTGSRWSYYLRWAYLRHRVRTLIGHQGDRFRALARMEAILAQCALPVAKSEVVVARVTSRTVPEVSAGDRVEAVRAAHSS